jgi:mRNA interferase HigB
MRLATKARLDAVAADAAMAWFRAARRANGSSFAEIRESFPTADRVGNVAIFNIRHNDYRLIATADFRRRILYVKALLTHKEYDRGEWKKWS